MVAITHVPHNSESDHVIHAVYSFSLCQISSGLFLNVNAPCGTDKITVDSRRVVTNGVRPGAGKFCVVHFRLDLDEEVEESGRQKK